MSGKAPSAVGTLAVLVWAYLMVYQSEAAYSGPASGASNPGNDSTMVTFEARNIGIHDVQDSLQEHSNLTSLLGSTASAQGFLSARDGPQFHQKVWKPELSMVEEAADALETVAAKPPKKGKKGLAGSSSECQGTSKAGCNGVSCVWVPDPTIQAQSAGRQGHCVTQGLQEHLERDAVAQKLAIQAKKQREAEAEEKRAAEEERKAAEEKEKATATAAKKAEEAAKEKAAKAKKEAAKKKKDKAKKLPLGENCDAYPNEAKCKKAMGIGKGQKACEKAGPCYFKDKPSGWPLANNKWLKCSAGLRYHCQSDIAANPTLVGASLIESEVEEVAAAAAAGDGPADEEARQPPAVYQMVKPHADSEDGNETATGLVPVHQMAKPNADSEDGTSDGKA